MRPIRELEFPDPRRTGIIARLMRRLSALAQARPESGAGDEGTRRLCPGRDRSLLDLIV